MELLLDVKTFFTGAYLGVSSLLFPTAPPASRWSSTGSKPLLDEQATGLSKGDGTAKGLS